MMSSILAMAADSTAAAPSGISTARELFALSGAMLASVTAILGVGVQWGRHAEFKEATNARLGKTDERIAEIEKVRGHAITREEMDARFAEMRALIGSIGTRFDDVSKRISDLTSS